jgi:hypothetical protein
MDIFSHVLIGRALATPPQNAKKDIWIITIFSYLPDLFQSVLYLYLGIINSRPFFFPLNSDWDGVRELHPFLSALWEVPHSIFFVLLVIAPIVYFFKFPKMALFGYIFHILIDLLTHSGEWATKLFYPFSYKIEGFTNAWSWPIQSMVASWVILLVIIFVLHYFFRRNKIKIV